jgi:hypothetical protein
VWRVPRKSRLKAGCSLKGCPTIQGLTGMIREPTLPVDLSTTSTRSLFDRDALIHDGLVFRLARGPSAESRDRRQPAGKNTGAI